jgi:hypothetical protein
LPHPCRCTFGPLDQAVLGELGERLAVLRIPDSTGTVLTVVARIASALDLDTTEVTAYVAEAVTRIADARWEASRRATARPPASPVPDQAEFPTPVTSAAITYPTTSRPTGAQNATAAVSASARSHHAVSA